MGKGTVKLSEGQREKARDLLQQLRSGNVEDPEDVVDDWEYVGERYDYQAITNHALENVEDGFTRYREHIPVSAIAGTTHSYATVMPHRLEKVLEWLLAGEFQVEAERPPKLDKIEDRYYVSQDGHHRVIAFKVLMLDEIYVEYIEICQE